MDKIDPAQYLQARALVIQSQRASLSFLQRNLRIGYGAVAPIMEQLEKDGVVSAMDHGGVRTVLIPILTP